MPKNREEDLNAHLSGAMSEQESGSTSWFKRGKKGIQTSTAEKKEAPDGLWTLCPNCKYTCTNTELRQNLSVCPQCQHHHRIGSAEYFDFLFDNQDFVELFAEVRSVDFLGFNDLKSYKKRLDEAYSKTGSQQPRVKLKVKNWLFAAWISILSEVPLVV
jgi:acetyl-CoA carboxylase carboxyl transferase subunit beta